MKQSSLFSFVGFRRQPIAGQPVVFGDATVTPVAELWLVRLGRLTLLWRRPTAVHVEQAGERHDVPVIDITRQLQIAAIIINLLNVAHALWRRDFSSGDSRHE